GSARSHELSQDNKALQCSKTSISNNKRKYNMNEYFSGGPRGGELDAMYYWNQFHPILAAVAILLIGWILALIIAAGIKKLLEKLGTNQRLSSTTGHRANIESIVSRIVFWIVLIIAVIGTLNVLNLTSLGGPFGNMIQQF